MPEINKLFEFLSSPENSICTVCGNTFKTGTGVLGETENIDNLPSEDVPSEPIEFCSVKCKNKYYKEGRKK